VSADSKPERFACSDATKIGGQVFIDHCETKTLDCAVSGRGISCVKKGGFK
jgi:hypothetical protein